MKSNGIIRKLIRDRSYGFIKSEGGEEVFFHSNQLQGAVFDALREGQTVVFEAGLSSKGLQARSVKIEINREVDNNVREKEGKR